MAIIGRSAFAGGTGYTIEFGEAILSLSIEGRMTICNMAIEAGARAGLIAVMKLRLHIKGRPFAPKGALWSKAAQAWKELVSDEDAHFDSVVELRAADIEPQVTWGTSPEMVSPVTGTIPTLENEADATKRGNIEQALRYMGLSGGTAIEDTAGLCIHWLLYEFQDRRPPGSS